MAWRSVLFVPGNRPDLAAKASRCSPDVIVLDLEDAIPPGAKSEARETACRLAEGLGQSSEVWVRVNAPSSPWFRDDIEALPGDLDAVVIPKWEASVDTRLPVIAGLETVRGVADARAVLGNNVVGCYFGAEDYIADLGGVRTPANGEVHHARNVVAIAARLAAIPALDMVTLDFAADARFEEEAAQARALGFAGKLCIHPRQVELANRAFVPTPDEVEHAARLLAAFEAGGGAVVAFEGQMVDGVIARLAQRVLSRAGS
jgi:citrate lyase subunit beta/citryl-CoA lyase